MSLTDGLSSPGPIGIRHPIDQDIEDLNAVDIDHVTDRKDGSREDPGVLIQIGSVPDSDESAISDSRGDLLAMDQSRVLVRAEFRRRLPDPATRCSLDPDLMGRGIDGQGGEQGILVGTGAGDPWMRLVDLLGIALVTVITTDPLV